jgi:acylphosphatase
VEQIVSRIGEVKRVFLVGDYAKGIDSGTIEVVLEGEAINLEYLAKLTKKAEEEIHKKVSVSVTEHFEGDGLLVFEQE